MSQKDTLFVRFGKKFLCKFQVVLFGISTLPMSLVQAQTTESQVEPGAPEKEGEAVGVPSEPDPTENISEGLGQETSEARFPIYGEGKTLPEKVLRVRVPLRYSSGTFGFDRDGKKVDSGISVNATSSALVLEYGVTDDLSLQILVPTVLESQLAIDAGKFRKTAKYAEEYEKFKGKLANALAAKGLCANEALCSAAIDSGLLTLPNDFSVVLPTGEIAVVKAQTSIKANIDSLIINAAKPEKGQTGLGDIELGVLYSAFNKRSPLLGAPIYGAIATGVRLPTGKFSDVPMGQLATGRGVTEAALRVDIDYNPVPTLMFTFQHRATLALESGTKKKSSILDGAKLNEADPTTTAAIGAGSNGKENSQKYERKGWKSEDLIKASWAVGGIVPSLNLFAPFAAYRYSLDSEERLDGVAVGPKVKAQSYAFGVLVDGLMVKFPAQVEFEYEVPFAGRNKTVVAGSNVLTLRGYYKF